MLLNVFERTKNVFAARCFSDPFDCSVSATRDSVGGVVAPRLAVCVRELTHL